MTTLAVKDADFFIPSRDTLLPLVDIEIPTNQFFLFAPILATLFFVYFQITLIKLWDALKNAPAQIKSRSLSTQIIPWIVADMGLNLMEHKGFERGALQWLSTLVTGLLVFFAAPIIIGFMWIRFWPAHSAETTWIVGGCLAIAVLASSKSILASFRNKEERKLLFIAPKILFILFIIIISIIGFFKTERVRLDRESDIKRYTLFSQWGFYVTAPQWLVDLTRIENSRINEKFSIFTIKRANLANVEFVSKPKDWMDRNAHKTRYWKEYCKSLSISPLACGKLEEQHNINGDTEKARQVWYKENFAIENNEQDLNENIKNVFTQIYEEFDTAFEEERENYLNQLSQIPLRGVDWRNANLRGSFLVNLDMQGALFESADLRDANFENANLDGTNFEDANLRFAHFENADLSRANFESADLSRAKFENADLWDAHFENADLSLANFENAVFLWGAKFENADLQEALFENADLWGAKFENADLSGANFENAVLWDAKFENAVLSGVNFENASLEDANFKNADLRDVKGLTQIQLNSSIGSKETKFLYNESNILYMWSFFVKPRHPIGSIYKNLINNSFICAWGEDWHCRDGEGKAHYELIHYQDNTGQSRYSVIPK